MRHVFNYFLFYINMLLMVYFSAMHNYLAFLSAIIMVIAYAEIELSSVMSNIDKKKDDNDE